MDDNRADPVFQLRDDFPAAVECRWIGGKQYQHVQVEADGIAANLHVAFFQNIEQAHLHELVQFGQFVHGEDAAMHAGNQAEVQRTFRGHAFAVRQFGRVDFADHIGELRPGRETLCVAVFVGTTSRWGLPLQGCSPETFSLRLVIG